MLRYSDEQLQGIRKACALAAEVRAFAGSLVRPGVTGTQVDKAVHERIVAYGAYPAPLNYMGFPKSVCFSVNEVVCHGIPDERPLEDGDIVSVDVSVYVNGYFGDCCATYEVGSVDEAGKRLVVDARETLDRSIGICADGVPFSKVGDAVCDLADPAGYGVVDTFCGHGIGTYFHAAPVIFHSRNKEPGKMASGMVFTIEPMITEGTVETVRWPDQWTILTRDGSRCAQFEETLTIGPDGKPEVLTTTENFADYYRPLPA
jgi:methionyl aminopeptidase